MIFNLLNYARAYLLSALKCFQGLSNYKKYAKKVWKSASSIQAFGTNSIDRQFGFTFVPILAFAAMAVVSGTAFGIQTIEDEENRQKQAASNSDSVSFYI